MVLFAPDWYPMRTFESPPVLREPAAVPMNTHAFPILLLPADFPINTLLIPPTFLYPANVPTNVFEPAVLQNPA